MNKGKKIIIAIVIFIVLIGGFIAISEKRRTDEIRKSEVVYEKSLVEMVEASMNLYYASHNSYPYSTEVMLRDLENDAKTGLVQKDISRKDLLDSIDTTKRAIKELKDFHLGLRGDEEAYQITYTDFEGNKKVVEGNYNKEFH